jgi:hypothetical protein
LPDFHRTLSREGQRTACLLAFDLLAIDGRGSAPAAAPDPPYAAAGPISPAHPPA